ncbi:hypothetical protein D3C72_734520 [compost metagenome]
MVTVAGLVMLCRSDPVYRSIGRTFTKPGTLRLRRCNPYFLVSVAAPAKMATSAVVKTSASTVAFATWDAVFTTAATGQHFSWHESFFCNRESLCRAAGYIHIRPLDPGRNVAASLCVECIGNQGLVSG